MRKKTEPQVADRPRKRKFSAQGLGQQWRSFSATPARRFCAKCVRAHPCQPTSHPLFLWPVHAKSLYTLRHVSAGCTQTLYVFVSFESPVARTGAAQWRTQHQQKFETMLQLYLLTRPVVQTEQEKVTVHAANVQKKSVRSWLSKEIHIVREYLLK